MADTKKVHFLGISGSGASAVAAIAQANKFKITGCDKVLVQDFIKDFNQLDIFEGHDSKHLADVDILAVTPAIYSLDPNNEELLAAKEKGIEVITWQEFMGKYLEEEKMVVAVCGTHGKSTVTAMIGVMLEEGDQDPTVELGAIVPKWGKNYRIGKYIYFVTEADEFNDNFLVSHPNITVLIAVEFDHPEYFENFDAYKQSFLKFLYQTKQFIIANFKDPGVREVLEVFQKNKDKEFHPQIIDYSKSEILSPLKIPGDHNKMNAAAVLQVGLVLGIEPEKIHKSLSEFDGLSRRFELIKESDNLRIYSDFAHNPGKIMAALATAREENPDKKIWVIFQPHMFSRTLALQDQFVKILNDAKVDRISITDIYASREVEETTHSKKLVDSANNRIIDYIGEEELEQNLADEYKNYDVIFFVGAGDIDATARKFANSVF